MKIKIRHYVLNTHTRELVYGDKVQVVRPKTLALLRYLITHPEQIISKSQLLDEVWDDVQVNEGVIFQSVREIRQLFSDITVIQNHPRKGYEWLITTTPIPELHDESEYSPTPNSFKVKNILLFRAMIAISFILLSGAASYFWFNNENQKLLLIESVQSRIDRNDHQWLADSGAAMLREILSKKQSTRKIRLFSEAELAAGSDSWSLAVKTYGDVYDYKLIYSLSNQQQAQQFVLFSHDIELAFSTLAENVDGMLGRNEIDSEPEQTRLAQMVQAYETDWALAIPVLQRLIVDPQSDTEGVIMLARLLIWKSREPEAKAIVNEALQATQISEHQRARLLYLKALSQWQSAPEQALSIIASGLQLTHAETNWLTRAKLEELQGDVYRAQAKPVEAMRSYLKAQSFYDEINAPVNAAGLKLRLSLLHLETGQTDLARRVFEQARSLIQSKEMSFLYGELQEFSQYFPEATTK
ncbi:winged helix-turn-helix domain-containing protein [Planctobacterium marinum]|uniref:winged helix-turn-helix domain-containing protein n=1 Tax=Planctobacterium marinum TaxID=1631968 RepID=UPI001E51E6AE|nr:winged helix-turn-helix domain-containing protein [Planctobacterium marinum]MCC2606721.1 winged helix-turn-helix domain-containing protein [Planctobacterium marinum]